MFFPYKDDNPTNSYPFVTQGLIILNAFIFLWLYSRPDYADIVKTLGFIPERLNLLTLFTSLFLHYNIFHLILNMWYLFLFGDNVEDKLGSYLFLIFYVIGGIIAFLAHALMAPKALHTMPCIGASGAVSVVMGGYIVLSPHARIKCIFGFLWLGKKVRMSAFLFLGIWFVSQLFWERVTPIGVVNIAYWAHIGGFLFGAGVVYADKFLSSQSPSIQEGEAGASLFSQEEKRRFEECNSVIDKHLSNGEIIPALDRYEEFSQKYPSYVLPPQNQKIIANLLSRYAKNELAIQAYLKFIFYYNDLKERIHLPKCRIGLSLINDFKNLPEGLKYLHEAIQYEEYINDKVMLKVAKGELARIKELIKQKYSLLKTNFKDKENRFAVLPQFVSAQTLDTKNISQALLSIGHREDSPRNELVNIGVKLAHNVERNLESCYGAILQNLTLEELELSVNKLESIGIPVITIRQENLYKEYGILNIDAIKLEEDTVEIKGVKGGTKKLKAEDIIFLFLGRAAFASVNSAREKKGLFTIEEEDIDIEEHRIKFDGVANIDLVDIIVAGYPRMRFNSRNFNLYGQNGERTDFGKFIKNICNFVGFGKIDERARIFISNNSMGTIFKNIREFNEATLLEINLKHFYDGLMFSSSDNHF